MFIRFAAAAAASVGLATILSACGGGSDNGQPPPNPQAGLSVLAGHPGGEGNLDGTGTSARLATPFSLTAGAPGTAYAIAGAPGAQAIRKVTAAGVVTSIPQRSCGTRTPALLGDALAAKDGSVLFTDACGIWRLDPAGGVNAIYTSTSAASQWRIAQTSTGALIVTDRVSRREVWKLLPDGTTQDVIVAPDSPPYSLISIEGDVVVDAHDNIYLAAQHIDYPQTVVRKIAADGTTTDLLVGPPGPLAYVGALAPSSIAVDANDIVWAVVRGEIWRMEADGTFAKFATHGPVPWSADDPQVQSIAAYGTSLLVGARDAVWRLDRSTGEASLLAGLPRQAQRIDGAAGVARFDATGPMHVGLDGVLQTAVLDEQGLALRRIAADGTVSTRLVDPLLGTPLALDDFATNATGRTFVTFVAMAAVYRIDDSGKAVLWAGNGEPGDVDGVGAAARFSTQMSGPVFGADGTMYVGDSSAVKKISADGKVTTISRGACPIVYQGQSGVVGLALEGIDIYVACGDSSVHHVAADGTVSYVAGQPPAVLGIPLVARDGTGTGATFTWASGNVPMTMGADHNLYVGDGSTLRRVTPAGVVTTVAGVAGHIGNLPGDLPGSLDRVVGVAALSDGSIAVSSAFAVMRVTLP